MRERVAVLEREVATATSDLAAAQAASTAAQSQAAEAAAEQARLADALHGECVGVTEGAVCVVCVVFDADSGVKAIGILQGALWSSSGCRQLPR